MALLLTILSATQGPVTAQTQIANADWEGEWLAEGTLFRIGVTADNGLLKITQIESMGQIWSSGDGKIDGNIARVEVCLLYTSPSPRDRTRSRMPSSA